jgi:hypothetical protein
VRVLLVLLTKPFFRLDHTSEPSQTIGTMFASYFCKLFLCK